MSKKLTDRHASTNAADAQMSHTTSPSEAKFTHRKCKPAEHDKSTGNSKLHTAKTGKQIREYIAQGISVDIRNRFGETPLHTAANLAVARALIEAGADVNACDNKKNTPLHNACSVNVAKLLLDHGAKLNVDNCLTRNPLFHATTPELIQFFLDQGLRKTAHDHFGRTPLYYADTVECAKLLIPINFRSLKDTDGGCTPLHYVESIDVLLFLIENGAKLNALDDSHRTPLMMHMQFGCHDQALALLQAGADPTICDCTGKAPIHYANANLIPELLKAGANINQQDAHGNTALHCAVNSDIINALIENGADLTILNHENRSCLDHLIDIGYKFSDFFPNAG